MALGFIGGVGAQGVRALIGGNRVDPPKTVFGKLLGGISGRNRNAQAVAMQSGTGTTVPRPPVQNRPLASGTLRFGQGQNRNVLNLGILAVLAVALWRGLSPKRKRRR